MYVHDPLCAAKKCAGRIANHERCTPEDPEFWLGLHGMYFASSLLFVRQTDVQEFVYV